MAITHDYVSWSTGNDYKGASFVDGAYTSATKTLVKLNAFAASKVNHWLYLESNDGGSIVAGYYKIATWTDANTVILATDAGAGVDDDAVKCTQHDGTTLLPWRSDQGACDLCTRNTTDGNQVNIKAGTAVVHAAALDLTTFLVGGALSRSAPLIMRGYTSAANDGGIGEIDCGGATMFAAATYDHTYLVDLEIHTFGDNNGIVLDTRCTVFRCEVHKGASSPSAKYLLTLGNNCHIYECYVHDGGAGNGRLISLNTDDSAVDNYLVGGADFAGYGIYAPGLCLVTGNVILVANTGAQGIICTNDSSVLGNSVYNSAAGTGSGIGMSAGSGVRPGFILNNIVVGWIGANGEGVSSGDTSILGHNAFYNNTANYTISDQTFIDLTANDVTLAADPFTSAATGDFSLTAAAKTALAAKGFPLAYLGAHANTVPNLNIGPIQLAASAGGGGRPAFGDRTGGKF